MDFFQRGLTIPQISPLKDQPQPLKPLPRSTQGILHGLSDHNSKHSCYGQTPQSRFQDFLVVVASLPLVFHFVPPPLISCIFVCYLKTFLVPSWLDLITGQLCTCTTSDMGNSGLTALTEPAGTIRMSHSSMGCSQDRNTIRAAGPFAMPGCPARTAR